MADPFRGKVALVTGGASGIGLALGRALAARGAKVVLADLDPARIPLVDGAWAEKLDVRDAEGFARLARDIQEREGSLDYLFNNAGVGHAGEVRDTPLADWRRVMEVNLMGVVNGVAAAYPLMIAQGAGHIVNTASGAGLVPRPGMVPYAASKHAVVGLSLSLRAEARALGVRVTALCPGYVKTAIMAASTYRGVDGQALAATIPIRPISAEDCARICLRGVAQNRAVVPVGKLVWLEWLLFRLSPALGLCVSAVRGAALRAQRKVS